MSARTPPILLMGPTASGKTEIAVRLVQEFPLQIISVDSAMIYRGMDIGTAKPDATVRASAPHRLVDILDPAESYSAARFCSDAGQAMEEIYQQGKIPLFVGGTFLYFKALQQGLSVLPSADAALRERLAQWAQAEGWMALHAYLASVDPIRAARIHPNDPQRLLRALEVFQLTGKAMSSHFELDSQAALTPPKPLVPHGLKIILAAPDRSVLHQRIEARFRGMLNQGLVAEVETLHRRGDLHAELPSIRAVGYRQVWDYLDEKQSYPEMLERALAATRQFAKRQYTWLRHEHSETWLNPSEPDLYNKVLKKLAESTMLVDS